MFLVASGYTMVIPFLPLYLGELGVPDHEIALWTGLVFSSCFLVAGIMGPIWGKLADLGGKKKWPFGRRCFWDFPIFSADSARISITLWQPGPSRALPMDL